MKKTLTVNLGGTVYHIDEDAYVLLDNYLNNLRYHFRKEAGADEIVRDMDFRIVQRIHLRRDTGYYHRTGGNSDWQNGKAGRAEHGR